MRSTTWSRRCATRRAGRRRPRSRPGLWRVPRSPFRGNVGPRWRLPGGNGLPHDGVGFVGGGRGSGRIAVFVDRDDVHLAGEGVVEGAQVLHRGPEGLVQRLTEAEEGDDAVGGQAALGHLAATGAGGGAPAVVGVVAGPGDRGISEAAGVLPGPAGGADAAGDPTGPVAGDDVGGAVGRLLVDGPPGGQL